MNQHALTWPQLARLSNNRLPPGQRSQRTALRDVMKDFGLSGEFLDRERRYIRHTRVACRIRQTVNLVADFESRHAFTEFLDDSGQVPSENEREFMRPEVFHVTFHELSIDRVQSRCADADETHPPVAADAVRLRSARPPSAVVVNSNRFHFSMNDDRPRTRS